MASIFTKLARKIGVGAHPGIPEEDVQLQDDAHFHDQHSRPASASAPQFGQFQPIIDAIRSELVKFSVDVLAGHRAIASDFCCQLLGVSVEPVSPRAHDKLMLLVSKHSAKDIAKLLERLLANVPHGECFDFSAFGGLEPVALPTHSMANSATKDLLNEIQGDFGESHDYKVSLRWEPITRQPAARAGVATEKRFDNEKSAPSASGGESIQWMMVDAQGERVVYVVRRGPENPMRVGKDDNADMRIDGLLTSGKHGEIWWERGSWMYRDLGSTNGSRIVRPGKPDEVFPSRKDQKGAREPVEITPGTRLFFASEPESEQTDPRNFPVLTCPMAGRASATPEARDLRNRGTKADAK